MKKYMLSALVLLFSLSCNAQQKEPKKSESEKVSKPNVEHPKGNWKVDKEYDENGNLTRYDSIYSWSSHDNLNDFSDMNRDSLLMSIRSRFFQNFSDFDYQGFPGVFSQDSILSKHFFQDDFFGSDFSKDFMDIDKIRQDMIDRQKKFLEKYRDEFIKPEKGN